MKVGKSALKRLFRDIRRKGLSDAQFDTLIESLWRDALLYYKEKSENQSATIGVGLISNSFREMLIGSYAKDTEALSTDTWNALDLLFALGNGTDTNNRSNAAEAYKSGLIKIYNALLIGPYDHGNLDPVNGMLQYTEAAGLQIWQDTDWKDLLTDAPSDNKAYGRKDAAYVEVAEKEHGDHGLAEIVDDLLEYFENIILNNQQQANEIYSKGDHNHDTVYQKLDADLTAIAEIAEAQGYLRKTAENTWKLDDTEYLSISAIDDLKAMTGFVNPSDIDVSYNWTNRTITLTGVLDFYWRGRKMTLATPWTSPAHDAVIGKYMLYMTDGVNFAWSNTMWSFSDAMAALANYKATAAESFAICETHGTLDALAHEEDHDINGTYLLYGGKATAGTYALDTASDAANSPGFDQARVKDEDRKTIIPAWTQGTYTTMYVGAGSTSVFNIAATLPFVSAGSYMQVNNPLTGAMTAGANLKFYNVYQILIPVASDVNSQRYRMVMVQPQRTFADLESAEGEDANGLLLGELAALTPEFKIFTRLTYKTLAGDNNTGKCRIASITYIGGTRSNSLNIGGILPSSHAALSKLAWLESGHYGTANKLTGFGADGLPAEIDVPSSSFPDTITGDTINADDGTKHAHKVENIGSEKIIDGALVEYGNIYNGHTANGTGASSIAKVGWNVVSNAQLLVIQSNLGGSAVAGGKMKEAGLTHWNTPNTGATNESGFAGRGNGYRAGSTGTFYALKEKWSIWTATIDGIKHYLSQLHYNTLDFHVAATWSEDEKNGHAIRLAKDTTTLADGETGTYIGNDSKVYPTKCYGTVEIMTCNLAETLLRDGTPITKASLNAEWTALTGPGYCSCNNDDALVGGQTQLSAIISALQNIGTPWVDAIALAIANLVDTAPATLDTLNELAAALGDDPNFATTITNLIAGKLSLDDPRIGNWNWAHAWSHQHSNFLIIEAITAAMTARIGSTLSAFQGLCTNEFGNIISHAVSVNELSHLIGVTSDIQPQFNGKAALAGSTTQDFGVQKLNLPSGGYIQVESGNIHIYPGSGEVVVHGQVTATTFYKT